MTAGSSVLSRLASETRRYHDDLDRPYVDLMSSSVSVADYRAHLSRLYGFEAPFESACRYTPAFATLGELCTRPHAGLVAQDLITLGMSAASLSALPMAAIAPFRSIPAAVGWMYSVERPRLMYGQVRRELVEKVPSVINAAASLATYDEAGKSRWSDYGVLVERLAVSTEIEDQMMNAALDGCRLARAWFLGN